VRTVIDGYNLLFRDLDPAGSSLEEVRDEFVRRVDAARRAGADVTIVFDGRPGSSRGTRHAEGLDVRYSASPRTADDLIVTIVAAAPRNQTIVLTRDRELGHRVKSAGGRIGDPDEFFRAPRRTSGPRRGEKPKPPQGPELDDWERLFRERDPDA
jgi:predicted RNA-binding protein with PIN domain